MGAFSTGIMLLGIAFLYGSSAKGSFFLDDLAPVKSAAALPMMMTGLILLMISMAFKVSAAPFHFWTPDVYDGAPTVITSFMATVVKAGTFIAFIRLFGNAFSDIKSQWQIYIAVVATTTLFIGNITAVFQQSVKRMLAYSSIAQVGFMLLSILTLNTLAKEGILLYVAVYSVATIGLFAILVKMKDFSFDGFNGMAKRYPVVAFAATIFLLSLAGSSYGWIYGEILYDCYRNGNRFLSLAGDIRPALRYRERVLLFPGHPGHVLQRRGGAGTGNRTRIPADADLTFTGNHSPWYIPPAADRPFIHYLYLIPGLTVLSQ